jgi:hypothetical protein
MGARPALPRSRRRADASARRRVRARIRHRSATIFDVGCRWAGVVGPGYARVHQEAARKPRVLTRRGRPARPLDARPTGHMRPRCRGRA